LDTLKILDSNPGLVYHPIMIAKINDNVQTGAACKNCKGELVALKVDTNKGKQAVYYCQSENCPRRGILTAEYFPPADTGSAPAKAE
jgi:hypothetical protein